MAGARRDTNDNVSAAVERLLAAEASGIPCAPVRDLIGRDDVHAAYAVQRAIVAQRITQGAAVVGRKIGLTSEVVQRQLGVAQPDFGILLSDMEYQSGEMVPCRAVLQPRVEAEIAFVLRADLAVGELDLDQVRDAIDHAVAAVEVCGSRIENWDISFGDTVADNASAGAFVLGPVRRTLAEFEPRDVEMELAIDGEVVSKGTGAACLGDPLVAVQWLARKARELGEPLRAGHLILSGALGPMRGVAPGTKVTAEISGLGGVWVSFGEEGAT